MIIHGNVVSVGTAGNLNAAAYFGSHRPKTEPESIYVNVQIPEVIFVGRSSELCNLKDLTLKPPHIIVISGVAGIGKTQLTRKFIQNNQSTYKNVIWIDSEKAELICESFKNLAESKLDISTTQPDGRAKDINSVIKEVFTKLSNRKTLFVYDNVDSIEKVNFLLTIKTSGERPHVIATSRSETWSDEITVLHLKELELKEAIEYVSIALQDSRDLDDDKKLLVEALQAIPLALLQATSYIRWQRRTKSEEEFFTITDYIVKFDTQVMPNSKNFEQTTYRTWKILFDAIEQDTASGELAIRILNIIAYFDSENIQIDIFKHLRYEQNNMTEKIDSAIMLLVRYSLLDWVIRVGESKVQVSVVSVHKSVQKVVQLNLQETNQEKHILQVALKLISDFIQKEQDIVNVSLPHVMSVFLCALNFKELIHEHSILHSQILSSLIRHRQYYQAKVFSDKIRQYFMNISSESAQLGTPHEAFKMFEDICNKHKIILEHHPNTVMTRSTLLDVERTKPTIFLRVICGFLIVGLVGIIMRKNKCFVSN